MTLPQLLKDGLIELGEPASRSQIELLESLCELLGLWSSKINLTGHRDPEAIGRRLVLGAAALLRQLPPFASLADLGSGAGFPGFPIAILRPAARLVLVESKRRRHHFQRAVVRELGLENVALVHGRIEEVEAVVCDVVIAQAVAKPDAAIDLMRGWAAPGGALVLPGSEAPPRPMLLPGVRAEIHRYREPLGGPSRTVWVGHLESTTASS